jgi:hypothetical protein
LTMILDLPSNFFSSICATTKLHGAERKAHSEKIKLILCSAICFLPSAFWN